MGEFESSDETLFASEDAVPLKAGVDAAGEENDSADEVRGESAPDDEGEDEGYEDEDEGYEGEDEGYEDEDEGYEGEDEGYEDEDEGYEDPRTVRAVKRKARRTFNDDQQKVAVAGAVAGAITVGGVMLLLSVFDLW